MGQTMEPGKEKQKHFDLYGIITPIVGHLYGDDLFPVH